MPPLELVIQIFLACLLVGGTAVLFMYIFKVDEGEVAPMLNDIEQAVRRHQKEMSDIEAKRQLRINRRLAMFAARGKAAR